MHDDAICKEPRPGDARVLDDAELLRLYVEETSNRAFTELVRRHIDFVYASALRQARGNVPLAQDVTQLVFTDLACKAAKLARHEVVVGWLHTATRFATAKAIRTECRRRARELAVHALNEMLDQTDAPVDWERLQPVLDDVLGELKERERAVILLRFFEKKPLAEVGAKLSLTETAARSCVDRSLEKMRALLAKRGVTSTSTALALALANQVGVAAPAGLAANVTGAALADAAGGTALGFLSFMSTTKFVAGAAAIIALLALGTAGYKVQARQEAETSLAAANQRYAALGARLRGFEERVAAAKQHAVELQQGIDAAPAQAAAAKAWNPVAEGKAFVQRHPEVVQAENDRLDAARNFRMRPLYQSLGLPPAQIDEILAMGREGWRKTIWLPALGKEVLVSYENPVPQSEGLRRLQTLLGEDRWAEWKRLVLSGEITARSTTYGVAKALCFTEAPLTPQQADQLVKIIAAGIPPKPYPNVAVVTDWDAIDLKVRSVLSSAQLPVWETMEAERRAQRDLDAAEAAARKSTPAK